MAKKIILCLLLFYSGAAGYAALEVLWRGYTHWTMALCGGLCLVLLWLVDIGLKGCGLLRKSLAGCLIITAIELEAGCLVNLTLGLNIWDYTDMPGNLLGQICLPFMAVWLALSFALFAGMALLKKLARLRYKTLRPAENISIMIF